MIRMLIALAVTTSILGGLAVAETTPSTNPTVLMKTSKGDITIELFADKAPVTVKNFLSYVSDGFYNGTIFHRVIKGFMIQGGGYTADMTEKPSKPPIKNEAGNRLKNARGTIAMARMNAPHTATSQFFINHINNPGLDYTSSTSDGFGYCVFGRVVSGMEVVDAIASVPTGIKQGMGDVPRETVSIISVEVIGGK